jgi:hypothetical protein
LQVREFGECSRINNTKCAVQALDFAVVLVTGTSRDETAQANSFPEGNTLVGPG